MSKKVILIVLAFMLMSLPVLAEDTGKVVAVVEGQEITMEELDQSIQLSQLIMQLYQMNPQFTQLLFSTDHGQGLLNEYRKLQLEQYTIQILLTQEVEKRGLVLSDEKADQVFIDQVEQLKAQNQLSDEDLLNVLKNQGLNSLEEYKKYFIEQNKSILLINALQDEILKDVTVEDADAETYYFDNPNYFKKEASVHARHILLKSKEEAESVLEKLNNGADFAEMAKEFSTGPSGPNGGDLNYIVKGQTVAEFENVAFSLKVGEISGVVETQFGYHIITVEDIKPESIVAFEDAKEQIKANLIESKKQESWAKFVEELKASAKIEINL